MDRIQNRSKILRQIIGGALALAVVLPSLSELEAGTRLLPPPPPRNRYAEDRIQQEPSSFGQFPSGNGYAENTRGRFSALEDEEGNEVSVAPETGSDDYGTYRRRGASRSPAGLEVGGRTTAANETSARPAVRPRSGNRPVESAVPTTEAIRQDQATEKFVTDLNDPITRRKGVQEVALIAGDLGFFPKTFFVSRDVPVRLFVTGAAKGSLCLMMDSFNVRKQIRANKIEEITFVPNQPGTYRFYCPVNGSEGTMVVKELTTNEGSGT